MLAIAGGVVWGGYLLLVYGLSQLAGQNYSIGDLAIPGKFTLGTPAPDSPGTGGGGGGGPPAWPIGPANPNPSGGGPGPTGVSTCVNSKGQTKPTVNGVCPKGYTLSTKRGSVGIA